jgi:octaprenyl-diphosphate synthase
MGDYLYATAFRLLSRVPTPEVMRVIADVCQDLCRGELHEVEARYRLDLTEEEYVSIIRDKTASLIGGCCHTGALLGGCSAETTTRLTNFGVTMGLAFQIIDDCLDVSGETARLGKATLTDLDKGILSLPIVYTIRALSRRDREELFAPLVKRRIDAQFLTRVAQAAQHTGAITKARQRADTLMREALASLATVPMNGLAATYEFLAAYTISRQT